MHKINLQIAAPGPNPALMALSSGSTAEESLDLFFESIASSENIVQSLLDAVVSIFDQGTTDPNRAYDGQPHTYQGERGKQKVSGLDMRDLADCLVRAFAHSANDQLSKEAYDRIDKNLFTYKELYDLDLSKTDPVAIIQNLVVEVEKTMGIYPNVPELLVDHSDDTD